MSADVTPVVGGPRSIRRLVLLGGGPLALRIAKLANDVLGADVVQVTRAAAPFVDDGVTPPQERVRISHYRTDRLTRELLAGVCDGDVATSLLLSVGAPWIVAPDVLALFEHRAFNVHPGRLPENRGASTTSWSILNDLNEACTTIHELTDEIDGGRIVLERATPVPTSSLTPEEVRSHHDVVTISCIAAFFELIVEAREVPWQPNPASTGNYFHPLRTDRHGWIDWRWTGDEIARFVHAFSRPYGLAMTLLEGSVARVERSEFIPSDTVLHPFAHGVITFLGPESLNVAVRGGTVRVGRDHLVLDRPERLREGSRFWTPTAILDGARIARDWPTSPA